MDKNTETFEQIVRINSLLNELGKELDMLGVEFKQGNLPRSDPEFKEAMHNFASALEASSILFKLIRGQLN